MTDELPWPFAGRVAGLIAGEYDLAGSYHFDRLVETLPDVVASASVMVSESTGLELPGAPDVAVVSRREWVDRNIGGYTKLVGDALPAFRADEATPAEVISRRLVVTEVGALLGFLSKRVLGQYELVLPAEDDADSIAFVGGNILSMERSNQFSPADFRMWIALHESAHRAQFVGVPWMRSYFRGLISEMIEHSKSNEGRLGRMYTRVREARRASEPIIDERGLMGFVASPAQSEMLDRVQALMSLLEGHGHFVMDRIGERVLTSQGRMSAILKNRRNDPRVQALFRLTGIEMKMKQYDEGEQFIAEVERLASLAVIDAAWESPESLPTLAEIRDPEAWIRRVG
jgi:coenzyme F420 biosynthesis associated uncharacterized protein